MMATTTVENSNPARRRTRNACDACRSRKIKCHYDGPACRACLLTEIPCTQERPRRKRGPMNHYVEEQREKQREEALGSLTPDKGQISGNSLTNSTPPGLTLCGLEQLAPLPTISQVLQDWFELVHPVAPILHRDSFLRQMEDQDKLQDLGFINLVLSLCAATVATLRRSSSVYGTSITVERCYELARRNELAQAEYEDPLWNISLEWCQTKYNFGVSLSSVRGMDSLGPQMLLMEATTGVNHLLHYRVDSLSFSTRELLKRLYWLCFAAHCTHGLHGRPYTGFFGPNVCTDIRKPLEITDAELSTITVGQEQWHGNITSYIPGLNALSNLFRLWFKSQGDSNHDLSHLQHHMEAVLSALDNIPPELRWRGGLSRPTRSNFGTDVQMVNLYITQFHIRSFLLDQMDRAAGEIGDSPTALWVFNARQSLVDDMLAIVYQMPEKTLEANGYSLIPKLRDIGLALLSENAGHSAKALANLDRLLKKLERLDGPQFDIESPLTLMEDTI